MHLEASHLQGKEGKNVGFVLVEVEILFDFVKDDPGEILMVLRKQRVNVLVEEMEPKEWWSGCVKGKG